jgi:hypothetical protein
LIRAKHCCFVTVRTGQPCKTLHHLTFFFTQKAAKIKNGPASGKSKAMLKFVNHINEFIYPPVYFRVEWAGRQVAKPAKKRIP